MASQSLAPVSEPAVESQVVPAAPARQKGGRGNSAAQDALKGQSAAQDALTGQNAAKAPEVPKPVDELALQRVVAMVLQVVPEDLAQYAETAIPTILNSAAYGNVRDGNQVAYLLATAEHESRFGKPKFARSESLVEDHNPYNHQTVHHPGNKKMKIAPRDEEVYSATPHAGRQSRVRAGTEGELDTKYWDAAYGGRLGNRRGTDDASRYRGRGYAQVTGATHYRDRSADLNAQGSFYHLDGKMVGGAGGPTPIDLANNPDHVNRSPELAPELLVAGSRDGTYTTKKLGDYIKPGAVPDFVNARRVINGDVAENGGSVAAKARRYAGVLASAWSTVFAVRAAGPR